MPDTTVLPTGGTTGGSSGPNWLLIGGAGVGLLFVLYFLSKQGGGAGQPTVAAGTSINAALGSIQEQNLNLMGQLGQTGQSLGLQIGGVSDQLTQTETDLTGTIQAGNQGVISAVNSGSQTVIGAVNAGNAATAQQNATGFTNLSNALASYFNNLLGNIQGVSGQVAGVSGQVTGVANQGNSLQAEISANYQSLIDEFNALFASLPKGNAPSSGGGSGGGGLVHTFVVNLPGGGQIRTNSTSAAGALNNVPGGSL